MGHQISMANLDRVSIHKYMEMNISELFNTLITTKIYELETRTTFFILNKFTEITKYEISQ